MISASAEDLTPVAGVALWDPHPVPFDIGDGGSVDTSRAAVAAHFDPRPLQDVSAIDLVPKRVEPSPGSALAARYSACCKARTGSDTDPDAVGLASCCGPFSCYTLTGLSTLGFDPTRFKTGPPVCYLGLLTATRTGLTPASDDEHEQAKITPLLTRLTFPCSTGRTKVRG
jgi:hypothetical protein